MTTVQKFKKSILFVVLYMVICDMTESTLPAFHCDYAGNVILESQDDLHKTEIVQPNGVLCKPKHVKLISDCPQAAGTPIEIIFGVPVKSVENGDKIIGGLNSEYGKLICNDAKVKVSATAKSFYVCSPYTIPTKANRIPLAISLSISAQITHLLGEQLTLYLEGPDKAHLVRPQVCTAKPSGSADTGKHVIWEHQKDSDDCHNEPAFIIKQWKTLTGTQNRKLSILMYAFRFASSPSVTIECSAFVCPSTETTGDCAKKCIDGTRRRRGAIHGIQTSPKSNNTSTKIMIASTSFEVQLGDQNTGSSAERLSKNVQLYSVTSIFVLMVTMMIR